MTSPHAPPSSHGDRLTVVLPRPAVVAAVLALPVAAFGVINLLMALMVSLDGDRWMVSKLSLDGEGTIPAYYNTVLLLLVAVGLAVQTAVVRRERGHGAWRWGLLSAVALGMSVDEAVGLHEIVGERFGRLLPEDGVPYNAWVFLGGALVLAVAVLVLPLLKRLPVSTVKAFLAAGVLFVGGAIGMELVAEPAALSTQWQGPLYLALMTVEEVLEMTGIIVFLAALLRLVAAGGQLELARSRDSRPATDPATQPARAATGRPASPQRRTRPTSTAAASARSQPLA